MNANRIHHAQALRAEGKPFREIGEILGVSAERARQLVLKTDSSVSHVGTWTEGLSARLAGFLRRLGYCSRAEVRRDFENGSLQQAMRMERGIGQGTIAKLTEWLNPELDAHKSMRVEVARAIALLEGEGFSIEKLPKS